MQDFLLFMGRHGSTELNLQNRYRGWSNGPDACLDDAGRQMARDAGAFLTRLPVKISFLICSPLERSQETTAIIGDILNIPEYHVDERLKPLNVGELAGQDKETHPMDYWLAHPKEKFPGGESVDDFNKRQYEVAKDILDWIASGKIKLGELLVEAHVSNLMYWWNFQEHHNASSEEYLSEKTDIVHPGGLAGITENAVLPLYRRNTGTKMPLSDGTALSGFVNKIENFPPRSCWNCKWFSRDIAGLGECGHPLVRVDPDLKDQLQPNGKIAVDDESCCNNFQNHPST
jgi:broad specificity phosphatase PhoE